jgi:hypothetical protein
MHVGTPFEPPEAKLLEPLDQALGLIFYILNGLDEPPSGKL